VDWSGWRWLWLAKEDLHPVRAPRGWERIHSIALHSSGWNHTPAADTDLVLDTMVFAQALVTGVRRRQAWQGERYVYTWEVDLAEPDGAELAVDVAAAAPDGLDVEVEPGRLVLAPRETATARVLARLPPAVLDRGVYLPYEVAFLVTAGSAREGPAVAFDVLHEPHGLDGVRVDGFQRLAVDGEEGDAATAWAVSGEGISDHVLVVGRPDAEAARAFGGHVTDARVLWLRRTDGALARLSLAQGGRVSGPEGALVEAPARLGSLALAVAGSTAELLDVDGELEGVRLLLPDVTEVRREGRDVPFTRDGQYVVLGAPAVSDAGPQPPDDAGPPPDVSSPPPNDAGPPPDDDVALGGPPDVAGAGRSQSSETGCACRALGAQGRSGAGPRLLLRGLLRRGRG